MKHAKGLKTLYQHLRVLWCLKNNIALENEVYTQVFILDNDGKM
ncbi:hypothetical protein Goari_019533 [Gossypium aridum]|uniref:Uncharacterized protein n=2 Tax=Gossypium TaxID=3633 RepID=A0A7J8WTB5_GOSAI|nr:hypothetical protein [Gossypium aridum]